MKAFVSTCYCDYFKSSSGFDIANDYYINAVVVPMQEGDVDTLLGDRDC